MIRNSDCIKGMAEIETETASLVIADLPYGIDFQSCRTKDTKKRKPKIQNDKRPFVWFLPEAFRITKDGGCLLCFCRWDVQQAFLDAIEWAGFKPKSIIVWDKQVHGMGDLYASFAPAHELVIFAVKGSFRFPGKRPVDIVREMRASAQSLKHPNEKPAELMEKLIAATTKEGDVVIDPFAGVGAAAVASARLRRKYIGFEIDDEYAEIARRREDEAIGFHA